MALPFSVRQRLSNLAGVLDEKLRNWAEGAAFQGDDSDRVRESGKSTGKTLSSTDRVANLNTEAKRIVM